MIIIHLIVITVYILKIKTITKKLEVLSQKVSIIDNKKRIKYFRDNNIPTYLFLILLSYKKVITINKI